MDTPPSPRPRGSFEDRARSVPYSRGYVAGVALCLAYYLCLIGALTALVGLARERHLQTAIMLATFLVLAGVLWFLSYLKRRDATCPLCKGTPLLDSQALKHQKAVRFFPLNYGTTNVVRIIFRQQFRCHFCGTPFDLLKQLAPTRDSSAHSSRELDPPDLPPAVIPPIAGIAPQGDEGQSQHPDQVTAQPQPAGPPSSPVV